MRILVFSDVHGNLPALEAMLSTDPVDDFDAAIYCGDSIGYFPDGEAVIERLRAIPGLLAVKGNHDQYLLKTLSGEMDAGSLADLYGAAYVSHYRKGAIEYLRSLVERIEVVLDGLSIIVVHGTPIDPLEGRLYPDAPLGDALDLEGYDMVICGHTHYPMQRDARGTIWLNPGSLGQPRDGGGFSYCVIDTDDREVTFKKAEVDTSKIAAMLEREPNEHIVEYLRKKMML